MKVFWILIVFVSLFSCSKKDDKIHLKYSADEFFKLAHETTSSTEKGSEGIQLADYSAGVNRLESKALMYERLAFFAIEFETDDQARAEAMRLNQYYTRNWLLDRVEGEPVLEDYVIETFHATNPNKHIQRVPKKHTAEGEHKEEHKSEAHH